MKVILDPVAGEAQAVGDPGVGLPARHGVGKLGLHDFEGHDDDAIQSVLVEKMLWKGRAKTAAGRSGNEDVEVNQITF